MKGPTELSIQIKFPVYGLSVWIIVTTDIGWSRAKKDNAIGHPLRGGYIDQVGGLFSKKEGSFESFLFLPPTASINTISHECYHAISWLFKEIGAKKEEELFAYHLGYLCEQADLTILKFKLRSKK